MNDNNGVLPPPPPTKPPLIAANAVFYQLMGAAPLLQPNGQANLQPLAQGATFEDMARAVVQLGLANKPHAIIMCAVVVSR